MKNKKRTIIIMLMTIISFITIIIVILHNVDIKNIKSIYETNRKTAENEYYITSKNDNYVLIKFANVNGIKTIQNPEGLIIECNGKNNVSIDYSIEPEKEYTFIVTDEANNTYNNTFTSPEMHIELTRNKMNIDLTQLKEVMQNRLNEEKIATNYVSIGIGDQSYVDTEEQDMGIVFNNWESFGDGNWTYDDTTKIIKNSKNSTSYTGYYYPNGEYTDIEMSFEAMTSDKDDDIIGAMIRFNKDTSNYTSYLFLLDAHDNGVGIENGAYNGLSKIINNPFLNSNIEKLSVNPNLKWTRNRWQEYKIIAKGNNISAYIDGVLVASAQDESVTKGTYGFLSYSQANTYFRNITINTLKENTLKQILDNITWEKNKRNIAINFDNESQTSLLQEEYTNKFNNDNIQYIGVSAIENKQDIESFLQNINNKGIYIDSSNYEQTVEQIVKYLKNYKNM